MSWLTPKTDWKSTDRFNKEDFNRIKNNMIFLHESCEELYGSFDIEDMGDDITSYLAYWRVSHFNAIEKNLETINAKTVREDLGITQTFYDNGLFIKFSELNRIESGQLKIYLIIKGWLNARTSLPFRAGGKEAFK